MTTETLSYRRERLRRGWLDLYQRTEGGAWGLAWDPDFGEPDWPGHTYAPDDEDLPSRLHVGDEVGVWPQENNAAELGSPGQAVEGIADHRREDTDERKSASARRLVAGLG